MFNTIGNMWIIVVNTYKKHLRSRAYGSWIPSHLLVLRLPKLYSLRIVRFHGHARTTWLNFFLTSDGSNHLLTYIHKILVTVSSWELLHIINDKMKNIKSFLSSAWVSFHVTSLFLNILLLVPNLLKLKIHTSPKFCVLNDDVLFLWFLKAVFKHSDILLANLLVLHFQKSSVSTENGSINCEIFRKGYMGTNASIYKFFFLLISRIQIRCFW